MNEWKDILTAPQDGTKILIVTDIGSQFIARWDNHFFNVFLEKDVGPVWMVYDCMDSRHSVSIAPERVTHWMYLPESPK